MGDKTCVSWRKLIAVFVAPIVAGSVVVAIETYRDAADATLHTVLASLVVLTVAAYVVAAVIALPVWLLLRPHLPLTAATAVVAGAVAAVLPQLVTGLSGQTKSFVVDGRAIIANYRYTAYGWHAHLIDLGSSAAAGAVAGLVFWLLARPSRLRR